jgi:hypothetical protein
MLSISKRILIACKAGQKLGKCLLIMTNARLCILVGKRNREQTYTMSLRQDEQPHVIEKSLVERDLGLMLSHDLKWVTQVDKATKAAKAIIAQIRNSFRYFDAELVRLLYVSLVRLHLEFVVPVWNPYLRKDIEKLENIQHRATRLAPRLRKKGIRV